MFIRLFVFMFMSVFVFHALDYLFRFHGIAENVKKIDDFRPVRSYIFQDIVDPFVRLSADIDK